MKFLYSSFPHSLFIQERESSGIISFPCYGTLDLQIIREREGLGYIFIFAVIVSLKSFFHSWDDERRKKNEEAQYMVVA